MITRYLLPLGVLIALVCTPALSASDGQSKRLDAALDKATTDDLVLPELDRPASKKKAAATEEKPVTSARRSAAAKPAPAAEEEDEEEPAAAAPPAHKSVVRTQGKGSYASYGQPLPTADDYPTRLSTDGSTTQYRPRTQPRTSAASSGGFRPATAQVPTSSGIQRPSQNAIPATGSLSYPNYGPQRIASRYQAPPVPEPTPAPGTQTMPETVAPGTTFDRFDQAQPLDGNCACADACCAEMSSCQHGGFFAGAEFLLIRPTFSENQAYLRFQTTSDINENTTIVNKVVPQNFDYNGSLRTFIGYRLCDCCGEIRFTYWNFGDSSRRQTIPVPEDQSITFGGHLELNALNPGDRLLVNSSLLMNTYDLDYSKCITYGGCDSCDPCNACPPWGLKYYFGFRIADVRRGDNTQLSNVESTQPFSQQAFIHSKFVGAGPRVGLEGRRFFGCDGSFSLYARSNFALLLGQYDINETRFTPGTEETPTTLTERLIDSHDRIIPVAEIEFGANWDVTCNTTFSLGYMFQAWWDLGAFEQVQGNIFQNPIDDANILSLDGLFARLEYRF